MGAVLLGGFVLVAVAAPALAPFSADARVGAPFARPDAAHLLGTDDVGHDLLSLVLYGSRVTLLVGLVAATAATLVGTTIGLVAGYVGGWVDRVLMRLVDVVLSLPFLPLMIVVGVFLGPGVATQILVIAAVMWAGAARELRAQVLSIRERDDVRAAWVMGASSGQVLRWHVAPQVVPLIVPQFAVAARRAILFQAALSFLGLGSAGDDSWGAILASAHARGAFLTDAWLWWVVPPGLAITLVVLGFVLVGLAIEERAQPTLRAGGRRAAVVTSEAVVLSEGEETAGDAPLLAVHDLRVVHPGAAGDIVAVDGVDLSVRPGESVAVVGASGSGKTTLALAVLSLLPAGARASATSLRFDGEDLGELGPRQRQAILGNRLAFVPQDAMRALNPVLRVGDQIAESIRLHGTLPRDAVQHRVEALLEQVGIDPGRAHDHPHQLSGGMCQRVVLAMAVANDPLLLIADEPTSGVDLVRRAELAGVLEHLVAERHLALLVVTHDVPLAMRLAERLVVMQAGRVVDAITTDDVLAGGGGAYTRSLVDAVPRLVSGRVAP